MFFIDFTNVKLLVQGFSSQSTKIHIEYGNLQTTRQESWMDGIVEIAMVALFINKVDTFEAIDKSSITRVIFWGYHGKNQKVVDRSFINSLITGFCPEKTYVMDIFCAGVVMEQSFLKNWRVIVLCKDDIKTINLEAQCSSLLESNLTLQEWCVPIKPCSQAKQWS